jgi:probable HAF family extracellular repeat protein
MTVGFFRTEEGQMIIIGDCESNADRYRRLALLSGRSSLEAEAIYEEIIRQCSEGQQVASTGWPTAMNDFGQVVGQIKYGNDHAFIWTKENGSTDLGTLGGLLGTSEANDVNNLGQVVGITDVENVPNPHGFFWSKNTGMIDISTWGGLTGYSSSTTVAINDFGYIIGTSTFLYNNEYRSTPFIVIPQDIDNDGDPDVWFRDSNYDEINDLMINITSLTRSSISVSDINNRNQIIGAREGELCILTPDDIDGDGKPDLWFRDFDNDGINDLIVDLGLSLEDIFRTSYNDYGQIIGTKLRDSGENTAFIITPEDTDGDGQPDLWFKDEDLNGINDLLTDLGTLGGENSYAKDINDFGQVVGQAQLDNDQWRAFLWTKENNMTNLGALGGRAPLPEAINDKKQVLASASFGLGHSDSGLWSPTSGWVELGSLGGTTDTAWDINNRGQVVGDSGLSGVNEYHGYLLNPEDIDADGEPDIWFKDENSDGINDLMCDLGKLPGGMDSVAKAINDFGQVVGYTWYSSPFHSRPFFWSEETGMINLGPLGGVTSSAVDINNLGQVVGQVVTTNPYKNQAYIIIPEDTDGDGQPDRWFKDEDSDGINDLMTRLGTLGYDHSWVQDINNLGQVIGSSFNSGTEGITFLWTEEQGMIPLPDTPCEAINDNGQIVGGPFFIDPEDSDNDGKPDLWFKDENSDGFNDLKTRLVPENSVIIFNTYDINNDGDIIGQDKNVVGIGIYRAFINVESEIVKIPELTEITHEIPTITPGTTVTFSVTVPELGQLNSYTSWTGSDIVMGLISPSGRIINRDTSEPDISHVNGNTFEIYSVTCPELGDWTIQLYGADVPTEGEEVSLTVTGLQKNEPPTAIAGPDQVVESNLINLDGSSSFDLDGDLLTYSWIENGRLIAEGVTPIVQLGLGLHTITLVVNDGTVDSRPDMVVINVKEPTQAPVADAGGPYEGYEGFPIIIDASCSTDPDNDELYYRWDFNNDGIWDTGWSDVSYSEYTWFDDCSEMSEVILEVSDGYRTDIATTEVIIYNVAPTIGTINAPIDPVGIGTVITVSAIFNDPGVYDTHSAIWDWGDGTSSIGTITENMGEGIVEDTHVYELSGVYTITLVVIDNDDSQSSNLFQYVVVFDPEGGFVTGGGWITSPEGAYTSEPSLTGKASFGFVAKYKKGVNEPTGRTTFIFHIADLNFHSTDYQWLIVAGSKAQFKGSGSINGQGDYGFLLTAIDGQKDGTDEIDRFRIKIWDKATDTVIYDNQVDDDVAEVSTALEGGSIVIHKG